MSVPRFWREIPQRYTLRASECGNCQAVHFPPRRICPTCRRDSLGKMGERCLVGTGKVLAVTRVHKPAPGYEAQTPYWCAIIETPEGPRLIGQVVECEAPTVGLEVMTTFRRIGEDGDAGIIHYGMKWRPAEPEQDDDTLEEE